MEFGLATLSCKGCHCGDQDTVSETLTSLLEFLPMATGEPKSETGFLCRHHIDLVGDTRELKTRMDVAERELAEFRSRLESAVEKAVHADGFAQGTIPDLQQRLEKCFNLLGAQDETANVYHSQVREMAKDLEKLTARMDSKADKSVVDEKADKGKTDEAIKSCFLWVKVGFVGVSIGLLLWILTALAKQYGLPTP